MRLRAFAIIALLVLSLLFNMGCSSQSQLQEGKVNVITSFFPLYDFAKRIGGEDVNVINLIPTGVEPHDWTPKSKDISEISKAQVFVYNGAGLEGWVGDLLGSITDNKRLVAVEASKGIPLIATNASQFTNETNPGASTGKAQGLPAQSVDPHTWISPLSAMQMADNIKNGLIKADPAHQKDYLANYEAFIGELQKLHDDFRNSLDAGTLKRHEIVVSHQAFAYLCRDYGLKQLPIMGLSPDSEPTAKDLQYISQFVKEHHVTTIFFEELVSDRLAKTLAWDLGIGTAVLNPIEGLTEQQAKAGENYISLMRENLASLLKALN
ncbi:metal ABC transporter substrate-binding protein [Ferviditalea candida]|uniref:Metal ABC transporter substrate-binding protein n=1 Tax=Ferviditalea candida TaxID=3108399 RepID=A0ABU5ZG29_9BACL|nr:metal ABC transporter substrate-binding protein [Paenibacillaceae bacterium T2]